MRGCAVTSGDLRETWIAVHIFHDQQILAENGIATGRGFPRHFRQCHPNSALEPKPLVRPRADDGHGHAANVRGQLGEVVEDGFGQRVENVVAAQRGRRAASSTGGAAAPAVACLQLVGDLI